MEKCRNCVHMHNNEDNDCYGCPPSDVEAEAEDRAQAYWAASSLEQIWWKYYHANNSVDSMYEKYPHHSESDYVAFCDIVRHYISIYERDEYDSYYESLTED